MSLVHFPSLGITKNSLALSQTGTALLIQPAGEANNLSTLTTANHEEPWKSIPGRALGLILPEGGKGSTRLSHSWLRRALPSRSAAHREETCEILAHTGVGQEEKWGEISWAAPSLVEHGPIPFLYPQSCCLSSDGEGEFNRFSSVNLSELQFLVKALMKSLGSSQGATLGCTDLVPCYY